MKFYGVDLKDCDGVVQQEAMKANAAAFFQSSVDGSFKAQPAGQSLEAATDIFHGVEPRKRGLDLGNPIPGYSGTNRRFDADNIFGTTYQGARVNAVDSNNRIEFEKGETLKQTAQFMPKYAAA